MRRPSPHPPSTAQPRSQDDRVPERTGLCSVRTESRARSTRALKIAAPRCPLKSNSRLEAASPKAFAPMRSAAGCVTTTSPPCPAAGRARARVLRYCVGSISRVRRGAIIPAKSEVFRDILVKRLTLMLMTGKEYLQSIRDGRVIYVGKERVKDQTTHPAFADGARTYAALFDMKSDPAVRDLMTFEENGECYSMYYLQPRSQEDLRRRNRAHRKIADFCFGLMGRTPDAFAGNLTGLSLKPEVFDSEPGGSRNNLLAIYQHVRRNDLFATYAIVPPQVPWEKVIVHDNPALSRNIYIQTAAHVISNHQSNVRFGSKLRFMLGVASLITRFTGARDIPAVRDTLGRLAAMEAGYNAMIDGQIEAYQPFDNGFVIF